jgi:hypothetical protein
VSKDTSLFFPLVNYGYGAFLNDPPDTRLLAFVRSQSTLCGVAGGAVTFDAVTVDGIAVKNPKQYYENSPFFEVQLPVDNILKIVGTADPSAPNDKAYNLWLSPLADSGYYLFLNPLKPGTHDIAWNVTWPCGTQNIHYEITVPHH